MQTVHTWVDTTGCHEDELDEDDIEVYVCRVIGKWSEELQTWV